MGVGHRMHKQSNEFLRTNPVQLHYASGASLRGVSQHAGVENQA
jgi:hypothetical protein